MENWEKQCLELYDAFGLKEIWQYYWTRMCLQPKCRIDNSFDMPQQDLYSSLTSFGLQEIFFLFGDRIFREIGRLLFGLALSYYYPIFPAFGTWELFVYSFIWYSFKYTTVFIILDRIRILYMGKSVTWAFTPSDSAKVCEGSNL